MKWIRCGDMQQRAFVSAPTRAQGAEKYINAAMLVAQTQYAYVLPRVSL